MHTPLPEASRFYRETPKTVEWRPVGICIRRSPNGYMPMPESINGVIDRVTFHNPDNGFAVLRVQVKGRSDLVTVIGSTTSVTAGEHVEATGRWVIDRQHGQQFKADELKTTHPASAEGIEKYLASRARYRVQSQS